MPQTEIVDREKQRRLWLRLGVLFWLVLILFLVFSQLPDKNLHLVFCDVGQGDAVLARIGKNQVLIDGGLPGKEEKLLNCLRSQMPFWDRQIEVLVNTHPDEDHFAGLAEILKRYRIKNFVYNGLDNKDSWRFQEFKKQLIEKKVCSSKATDFGSFRIKGVYFDILWPGTTVKTAQNSDQQYFDPETGSCPMPDFQNPEEILNNQSIVIHLSWGRFDALLTGDIPSEAEQVLVWRKKISPVEVLKIAHHGSKTSTSEE
ncbi:MAG: MBL fold metallo-hydrolase, partial [Patescibacteria group bacterium]